MTKAFLYALALVVGLLFCAASPAYASPPGAIFTTIADGSIVNENQYSSTCAVYLDGGPGPNAPAHAAGLPDGDYYFQVTDPSGKQLLSTDPVSNRRFRVGSGVILAYTGTGDPAHPTGVDRDHAQLGAITIGIANITCPADFLNTPNAGGTYKVWATPVGSFVGNPANVDNPCTGGCFHGFLPSQSKTDNFKAAAGTPTFCLTVQKQLLPGYTFAAGWPITVTDSLGVSNTYFTNNAGQLDVCGLAAGTYMVSESLDGTSVMGLVVNDTPLGVVDSVYAFTWEDGKDAPRIVFQNGTGTPE